MDILIYSFNLNISPTIVCLNVILFCYRSTCSWFCEKSLCNKERGTIFARPCTLCSQRKTLKLFRHSYLISGLESEISKVKSLNSAAFEKVWVFCFPILGILRPIMYDQPSLPLSESSTNPLRNSTLRSHGDLPMPWVFSPPFVNKVKNIYCSSVWWECLPIWYLDISCGVSLTLCDLE